MGDEQTLDDQFEGARGQDILSAVINLEHVADIVKNSLVEFVVNGSKRGDTLRASAIVAPDDLERIPQHRLHHIRDAQCLAGGVGRRSYRFPWRRGLYSPRG